MLFASFDFLLFFAVMFAVYWALTGQRWLRIVWVVAGSYFFYMAGPKPVDGPLPTPWYFAGLLLFSTLGNYVCGLFIASAQRRASWHHEPQTEPAANPRATRRPGRFWLVVSVLLNLGILAYFKYTGFLLHVIADVTAALGTNLGVPALTMLLPVGISFYTFQGLGYTIDVYRGRIPAEKGFLRLACFLAFFPQLVAGPILRASDFLPQLRERPRLTREDVDFAMWRISKGLLKKVVLSDFIAASFTDRVFASPAEHSSLENLLALYAFTLQIYADFSGYSDIAIGVGRLLGFRIPENFNRPYQAVDVADFWRRWHITLSTWLRDYVYYPLGGSRTSPARTYVNLWLTMFLVGIWHGASWNFVIYALLQAGAMVYNRACRPEGRWFVRLGRLFVASAGVWLGATLFARVGLSAGDPMTLGLMAGGIAFGIGLLPKAQNSALFWPVHVLLTLHFSVLSRVFFRAEDLESARAMIGKLMVWDHLGVRVGLLGNEVLSNWLKETPMLGWTRPLADWSVLVLLVLGLAAHYTPPRWADVTALRSLPRVPAVVVGVGFAALLGFLGLLLAGPRANIYFAF